MASPLRIIPLGGYGEIGKNMTAFEYGQNILLIDCGIMFPENDMLGIDFIIPDWKYLRDKRDQIRGIVVTHGHEDHTGGLPYLLKDMPDLPVFATKLTRGLIEVKLRNHKVLDQARLQLTRPTRPLPDMKINPDVKDIFAFRYEDFVLEGYDPHPHIKAEVAV